MCSSLDPSESIILTFHLFGVAAWWIFPLYTFLVFLRPCNCTYAQWISQYMNYILHCFPYYFLNPSWRPRAQTELIQRPDNRCLPVDTCACLVLALVLIRTGKKVLWLLVDCIVLAKVLHAFVSHMCLSPASRSGVTEKCIINRRLVSFGCNMSDCRSHIFFLFGLFVLLHQFDQDVLSQYGQWNAKWNFVYR